MSEHFPSNHEHLPKHEEALPKHEGSERHSEAHHARHEHQEALEDIKLKIETEAISGQEIDVGEKTSESKPEQNLLVDKDLKAKALRDVLRKVRHHLSKPEKQLSKIIHQPAIEKASELGGKTVARPSGLLFGGISAFLGSLAFLYITKHFGYEYRFSAFILLFVGGFLLGLAIELMIRLTRSKRPY